MLYSQMASDMNVTTNLWEGLLSFDCYGKAVPSVAKEWSHNEDSSVWSCLSTCATMSTGWTSTARSRLT